MADSRKTTEDTRKFAEMVAQKQGWAVNPETDFFGHLVNGLTEQYNNHGYYLCPCRESWEERDKDKDVICPCSYAVEDIKEYGHCFCALFCSKEFAQSGKEAVGIPERRPEDLIP